MMMYSNGARMFTPGGTECIINSPEGIEAMQFYRDLQVKYNVMPTASEMADQTSAGGWGSGDINVFGNKGEKFFAMAYGGRYWFVQFAKMSREEGSDASPLFNIGCVKPPIFKYDYEGGSARCTGVNRNSKQKEYAMRFLEFLASPEFNRQINRSYDALSGVKKYCEAPWTISDNQPAPKGLECVNDPQWVDAMSYDYEVEKSPFIPPYRVSTIWGEEKGVLDAGNSREVKPVLDSYVRRVNEEIQRNAYADPKLKALYEKAKREDELWKKSNGGTR
jgi:ABC-type glycerol-3-phosphate transport system substrate-binding protein